MKKFVVLSAIFTMAILALPATAKAGDCRPSPEENFPPPNSTIIDFENFTVDPVVGYWDEFGVKFSSANGTPIYVTDVERGYSETHSSSHSLANDADSDQSSANQPLVITFKDPVGSFGFYFGNLNNSVESVTVTYFDEVGAVICSVVPEKITFSDPVMNFVGIESDSKIYSVTLDYGASTMSEEIDDLMFVTVPKYPIFEKMVMADHSGSGRVDAFNLDSYQKTKSYLEPTEIFISKDISYIDVVSSAKPGNNSVYYGFAMTQPISAGSYNESLVSSYLNHLYLDDVRQGGDGFHVSKGIMPWEINDSYRMNNDAFVYILGYMRNGDGTSEVPTMPVEVDDVSVLYLHLERKPGPDTTKPVITLLGSPTVSIYVNDTYTDAGATASDDVDGDISAKITTVNNVKIDTAGTYTVTYNVFDMAGNTSTEAIRTVTVATRPPSGGGGGGGGGSGGGSSGGGSYYVPPTTTTVTSTTGTSGSSATSTKATSTIGQILGVKVSLIDELIAKTKFDDKSDDVKALQSELQRLGFYGSNWSITGHYDQATKVAVEKYLASKNIGSCQKKEVNRIPVIDELIAITKYGDRSESVRKLQTELQKAGFFIFKIGPTGNYINVTKSSVEKYLASIKTICEGEVLGVKLNIIDELIAKTKFGERSANVSLLQSELQKAEFYPIRWRVTGFYSTMTKASVAKYLASKVR